MTTGPGGSPRADAAFASASSAGRVDGEVELQPREAVVQATQGVRRQVPLELADHGGPVDQWFDRPATVPEDFTAERVERPDPDGVGVRPERGQGRSHPRAQLVGRTLVERHRADSLGGRPGRHEPGDAGNQRRRLAAAGRGHAQDRPGGCGRGGTLVRGEPGKALVDRRMKRHGHDHRGRRLPPDPRSLAGAPLAGGLRPRKGAKRPAPSDWHETILSSRGEGVAPGCPGRPSMASIPGRLRRPVCVRTAVGGAACSVPWDCAVLR